MFSDKFLELLLQVPLAGVNIVVVILFLKYLEKLDVRQKEFIADQRKDNNNATLALSLNIQTLDTDISALKVVTVEHNALMLAAITEMRAAVNDRAAAIDGPKTQPLPGPRSRRQ